MSADLRRLGETVDLRAGRRRRRLVVLLSLGLVLAGGAAFLGVDHPADDAPVAPSPADADAGEGAVPADAIDAQTAPVEQLLLGTVDGLELRVPATDPVLVSYHEASFIEALPIIAAGTNAGNENPTRFTPPAVDERGPTYHVQVSRGRANAPTSAVDVVLDADTEVLSPVSGTVHEVRPYQLYNTHDDVRLELRPDGFPDLAVVLIHLVDVRVAAGDRVEVGDVLAGGARPFPFDAVVDRVTAPEKHGHVHLEVKPADAPPRS